MKRILAAAIFCAAASDVQAQKPVCPAPAAVAGGWIIPATPGGPHVIAYGGGSAFYMGFTPSSFSNYYMAGPYFDRGPLLSPNPPMWYNGRPNPNLTIPPVAHPR